MPRFRASARARVLVDLIVTLILVTRGGHAVIHEKTGPFGIAVRLSTLAGKKGVAGFSDGKGAAAVFNAPEGCRVTPDGTSVLVADRGNNAVRRIDVVTGQVSVLAGVASGGYRDGPSSTAQFLGPRDLGLNADGHLYIADYGNCAIRKLQGSTVTTVLGGTCIAAETNGICRPGPQKVHVILAVSEQLDGGFAGDVEVSLAYPAENNSTQVLPYQRLVTGSQSGRSYSKVVEVPALPTSISIRARWRVGTNWHDALGLKGVYLRMCGSREASAVFEDPTPGGTASGCSVTCQGECCYSTYWITTEPV